MHGRRMGRSLDEFDGHGRMEQRRYGKVVTAPTEIGLYSRLEQAVI
jgi:hypothetical protein